MKGNKVKALICGFIFSTIFSMLNFYGKCENISNKIFRLHIIANSNSEKDQSLKLKLRDEILKNFSGDLSLTSDINEAEKKLESKLVEIKEVAENLIHNSGFNYKVKVEISKSFFNIRRYKEVTLPSGVYKALKITIGEGKGKNWWCVMFPPICLSAAEEKSELENILNSSEIDIVENESEYVIKLKILEWFMKAENKIHEFIDDFLKQCNEFIDESYEVSFKMQELFENFEFL